MSDSPGTSPFEQFVIDLTRSGLVHSDHLTERLEAFRAQRPAGEDDAAMLAALAYGLIMDGTLTGWQCHNLRLGRHKGFYFNNYVLLGHVGTDDLYSYYLGRHLETEEMAVIRVTPLSRSKVPGEVEYEIVWRLPKSSQ